MVSITKVLEGLDRRPDVIKIDVEGNELRLLESLVTACVPMIREGIVITEILGSSAASQPDCLTRVLEAIRNEGLELLRIVDGGACEPVVADGPHLPPWADYVIAAPQRILAPKALSL